ncbi:hypothetical protein [Nostoc sp.]|uniref:hypothetical protein n=1 Tax=Nostoc sp. TaxID=1180 RepID=UPI002FF67B2E
MTANSCILAVRIINLQLTAAWERCYILSTMPVINLADIQQITKTQQQLLLPSQKYRFFITCYAKNVYKLAHIPC